MHLCIHPLFPRLVLVSALKLVHIKATSSQPSVLQTFRLIDYPHFIRMGIYISVHFKIILAAHISLLRWLDILVVHGPGWLTHHTKPLHHHNFFLTNLITWPVLWSTYSQGTKPLVSDDWDSLEWLASFPGLPTTIQLWESGNEAKFTVWSKYIASFPGSHTPECEHWSCADMEIHIRVPGELGNKATKYSRRLPGKKTSVQLC